MRKIILRYGLLITCAVGLWWWARTAAPVFAQCIGVTGAPCTPTPTLTATRGGGGGPEQNGQICVGAFLDANSNGSFDGSDSWLEGGYANITNLSTSAVTQSDFHSTGRTCHFLPGGTNYDVAETNPPSGYPPNPSTGAFLLTAGGVVNVDFPHSAGGGPCPPSLTAGVAGVPTCTPTPTSTIFTNTPCPGQQSPTAPCTPSPTPTPCVGNLLVAALAQPCTPTPTRITPTPTATPCLSFANLAVALVPQRCTPTPTITSTPTATPCVPPGVSTALCTDTPSPTPSITPTGTVTPPTRTPTPTPTGTITPFTRTPTRTPTGTITPPTKTPTATPSPTSITRISLAPPGFVPVTGALKVTCGDWVAFHTNRDNNGKNWEVYRLDGVEGQASARLYNLSRDDADDFTPSRSPDDKWVVFHSFRDKQGEIYIADNEGKKQVRLTTTTGGSSVKPLFSPDNRHVVFQSNRSGNWNLYLLDIGPTPLDPSDDKLQQLTNTTSAEVNPSWSPTGEWLAFESDFDGKWNIYLLNVITLAEYRLTNGPNENRDPAWSPNGKLIAFRSFVKGNWVLYTVQPNGLNLTAVTPSNFSAFNQAWSHDSTRLAYQSPRDNNYDIYVVTVATRKELRLTNDKAVDVAPSWDCADARIVFASVRTGNPDLFQVPSGGGAQSAMTKDKHNDQWPEWTPLVEMASRQLP